MEARLAKLAKMSPLVRGWERFSAVGGHCSTGDNLSTTLCKAGTVCTWSSDYVSPNFTDPKVMNSLAPSGQYDYTIPFASNSMAGNLGCWASHVSAIQAFVDSGKSEFMLILEDDVVAWPQLFDELPTLLDQLPVGEPWHALRFSTWNSLWQPDQVGDTSWYHVRHRGSIYDDIISPTLRNISMTQLLQDVRDQTRITPQHLSPISNPNLIFEYPNGTVFYFGSHATLVQRSTAQQLLDHFVACGAGNPDIEGYRDMSEMSAADYHSISNLYCGNCTLSGPVCKDMATAAKCVAPINVYTLQRPDLLNLTDASDASTIGTSGSVNYLDPWSHAIPAAPPKGVADSMRETAKTAQWPLNELSEVWPLFSPSIVNTTKAFASSLAPALEAVAGLLGLKLEDGGQLLEPAGSDGS